ncbi:MAG: ribosomal protein [Chlamydiia bacterium]|nr:ribosomal protein [Chlamydiia bacterium]
MSKDPLIEQYEQERMKKAGEIPEFNIGDTIRVHTRIIEEGGKERLQMFAGTVIARKGSGISETVALHRVAYGEGMERIVYLHSPLIAKIELLKKGEVRRSKLYYLRGTSGKAAKVKGRVVSEKQSHEEAEVEVTA